MNIIFFIIIIIILTLCYKKEFFLSEICPRKIQSGYGYTNMEVCKGKCPRFIPEHLKHKNYCRALNDGIGTAGCYPPDWFFN